MYWKAIGTSVDTVYANTYIANRIYGRPIFPLGQTYGGVSSADVLRFREEAVDYGATGFSFWDWQETPASGWSTLAAPLAPLTSVTPEHLLPGTGAKAPRAIRCCGCRSTWPARSPRRKPPAPSAPRRPPTCAAFQTAHGLPASGVTDAATWRRCWPSRPSRSTGRRGTERLSRSARPPQAAGPE